MPFLRGLWQTATLQSAEQGSLVAQRPGSRHPTQSLPFKFTRLSHGRGERGHMAFVSPKHARPGLWKAKTLWVLATHPTILTTW